MISVAKIGESLQNLAKTSRSVVVGGGGAEVGVAVEVGLRWRTEVEVAVAEVRRSWWQRWRWRN